MQKYLVTGGAGFIGANLVDALVKKGAQVIVVDDLSMGKRENLPVVDQVRFIEHSITDKPFMANLLRTEQFDYVVLLGAVASVADSIERPYQTHEIGQEANLAILETIRVEALPVKKVFFASSAAVYGNNDELPKTEETAVCPQTQYAVDKYAMERAIVNYAHLYDLPFVAARFFNVYGPKQNPASPYSGVISLMLTALLEDKPFTFLGDGTQTRDFVYVGDVVAAIVGLLHADGVAGEVFNIADGKQTTLTSVWQQLQALVGIEKTANYAAERQGDIHDSYASAAKIDALGLMTHTPLATGLKRYVEWAQA